MVWDVADDTAGPGDVVLVIDAKAEVGPDDVARREGYRLDFSDRAVITARTATAVFRGSLLQALRYEHATVTVPRGSAVDHPNYAVRGYMFDLGRKWHDPAYVRDDIRLASVTGSVCDRATSP